jgi:hypothetical protein
MDYWVRPGPGDCGPEFARVQRPTRIASTVEDGSFDHSRDVSSHQVLMRRYYYYLLLLDGKCLPSRRLIRLISLIPSSSLNQWAMDFQVTRPHQRERPFEN